MRKFTEQEWKAFQKRVEKASLHEKVVGHNLFLLVFEVCKHSDSSISIKKVGRGKFTTGV